MGSELISAIKLNTEVLFTNASIMLQTCNLGFILCDMPIWKHAYHMPCGQAARNLQSKIGRAHV